MVGYILNRLTVILLTIAFGYSFSETTLDYFVHKFYIMLAITFAALKSPFQGLQAI